MATVEELQNEINKLEVELAEMAIERQRIETVARISTKMSLATDEEGILAAVAELAQRYQVTLSSLNYVRQDEGGQPFSLEVVALLSGDGQPIPHNTGSINYPPRIEYPVFQWVYAAPDEPIFIEDIFNDPRSDNPTRHFHSSVNLSALALLPLKKRGQWQAMITFAWDEPQEFDPEMRILLKMLRPKAADVVAGRRAYLAEQAMIRENQRLLANLELMVANRTKEAAIFKAIVENSPDVILLVDTEKVVYANRTAHDLYGYKYETQELIGQPALNYWPKEAMPFLQETVFPQARTGGWRGELPQKRKDGSTFKANGVIFPVQYPAGKVAGLAVVLCNV